MHMYVLDTHEHNAMSLYLCSVHLSAHSKELLQRLPVSLYSTQGEQGEYGVFLHLQEMGTEGGVEALYGGGGVWKLAQCDQIIFLCWFS